MDLIAELHKAFDELEKSVKNLLTNAAPEVHEDVTAIVADVKDQASDLAVTALADAKADATKAAKDGEQVLETVDPNANPAAEETAPTEPADPPAAEQVPAVLPTGGVPVVNDLPPEQQITQTVAEQNGMTTPAEPVQTDLAGNPVEPAATA